MNLDGSCTAVGTKQVCVDYVWIMCFSGYGQAGLCRLGGVKGA